MTDLMTIFSDGLSSATILSSPKNQPYVIETLFKLLRNIIGNPGINFGFCCINHILLPMVQNWLRQNAKFQKPPDVWQNFKHCCGLASELVVDYLHHVQVITEPTLYSQSDVLNLLGKHKKANKSCGYFGFEATSHNSYRMRGSISRKCGPFGNILFATFTVRSWKVSVRVTMVSGGHSLTPRILHKPLPIISTEFGF